MTEYEIDPMIKDEALRSEMTKVKDIHVKKILAFLRKEKISPAQGVYTLGCAFGEAVFWSYENHIMKREDVHEFFKILIESFDETIDIVETERVKNQN